MQKRIVPFGGTGAVQTKSEEWLNLESASVEVSSEQAGHPIEAALVGNGTSGWRAAESGDQRIRIVFGDAVTLRRIVVKFEERETERTQEFTIRWAAEAGGAYREIVRQQWNFSPSGSTTETEDLTVNLNGVAELELEIRPDIGGRKAFASVASLKLA